jgi:hypothetical protein
MSFINITRAYTADPADPWTPKKAFFLDDPFAIVLNIEADASIVRDRQLFDAVFQIAGPQQDVHGFAWWTISGGEVIACPTRDARWNNIGFDWGTNFAIWWFWPRYRDAVLHIGNAKLGVFYVQGHVSVQGSDLFAYSERFWFRVR